MTNEHRHILNLLLLNLFVYFTNFYVFLNVFMRVPQTFNGSEFVLILCEYKLIHFIKSGSPRQVKPTALWTSTNLV